MTTMAAAGSLGHGTLVLLLIACLVLALAAGFATWSAWHREKVYEPRSRYARRSQAEHLRAVPAATVMFGLWALVCLFDLIWGQHTSVGHVATAVFGVGGLGAGVVAIAAAMTGRPSWAVPPALRARPPGAQRPGVFDEES
jgi:ABC-type phosphate transport system permease subunit